ncbi:MAG TPA: cytosine permease [Steroidobacteraceae bacterium]|jgi:purine-cytosine permease-like protein|nr:cytosine permease [Steroidobacteraceae bacterium]
MGLPRIETRSINYVPLAERHGKVWHLWPVWFSGNAQLATVAVGTLGITLGGNLLWSSVAVLTGCLVGTFFMAFHAAQGPQLGLPQMIQSRPQFGYRGAILVWVVALIAYIGYNALNQVLAAQALHELNGAIPATSRAAMVLFALVAMGLALVGHDKIHLAQRGVAYLMIAILTVFSAGVLLAIRLPPAQWQWSGFRVVSFLTEFTAAASYQLTWSIYVSDYSRYLPKDVGVRAAFWWTYLGAFVGGAWMMLVGTLAAAVAPTLGVAAAIRQAADTLFHGFGDVVLVSGLCGLITISALNFYGASLTLLSIADTVHPLRCTLAERVASLGAALVATAVMALGASGSFVASYDDLLTLLLYLFTPWTAINLIDFYVVRKGHYSVREIFNSQGMYGQWNWRGLTAYFVGFLVMIPFFSTSAYTGPIARSLGGADVSMFVGLPVAAAVYLLACRSMDFEQDRRRAADADLGLDAGVI